MTPERTTLKAIQGLGASFVAVSTFHAGGVALFYRQNIQQSVNAKVCGKFAGISTSRDVKLFPAFRTSNFTMDAACSLNPIQTVEAETVQTR